MSRKRTRGYSRILAPAMLLAGALLPAAGWGQWIKLSDGSSFSDVGEFAISPDGARVVYNHNARAVNSVELWSVPMTGGAPLLIGRPFQSVFVGYFAPAISPDGVHVLFATGSPTNLHRARVAGGETPVQLSVTDVEIQGLFSPDSQWVVFGDRQPTAIRLFSIPAAGGSAVRLDDFLVTGGDVVDFLISPDSSRVVYLADQNVDETFELFSVPIAGGAVTRLNSELVSGGSVPRIGTLRNGAFRISPDGNRVLYVADQDTDEVFELYSVPITGGAAVKLNGALVTDGDVSTLRDHIQILPDSSAVVYFADQETNDVREIYRVPIAGGTAVKLNGPLGGDRVFDFQLTPDGSRVIYHQGGGSFLGDGLYSVPSAGGVAPVKLSLTLVPEGQIFDFSISPDSQWVVYRHDLNDIRRNGYKARTDGPAGSGNLLWGEALTSENYQIDPTSSHVIVQAWLTADATPVSRLWRAPLGELPNPTARELVPLADFVSGGSITHLGWNIGPKGSVVYVADQQVDEQYELYSIPDELFADGFE